MDIKNFENKVQEKQLAFLVAKQEYEELCDVVIEEKKTKWMKGSATKNRNVGVLVEALTQLKLAGNHDCTDGMVLMVVDDMIEETGTLKRIMDRAREDMKQATADLERVRNEVLSGVLAGNSAREGETVGVCGPVEAPPLAADGSNSEMKRLLELVLLKLVSIEERQLLLEERLKHKRLNDGNIKNAVKLWCENNAIVAVSYGHISSWDVSEVTNMSHLFKDMKSFNDDISGWDVSKVTNMDCMFQNAFAFNQPLNSWDVSNVKAMHNMFSGAIAFNQPLNSWRSYHSLSHRVSRVTGEYIRRDDIDDMGDHF